MKTAKKAHPVRNTLLVLVLCGIVGLILSYVMYFRSPNPTYASAVFQFAFDGAADGIAPDGTKFDIKEMASDEVLEEALMALSMDSRYKVDQVRPQLVIRGNYPEEMASQVMNYESLLNFTASRELTVTDYHPTTFQIMLYDGFDPSISETELRALLEQIIMSYQAYFTRVYSCSLKDNALDFDLENYDYPQQLDIIRTQLKVLENYAAELYEKEPAFRLNGVGFNDIVSRLHTLDESDVSRISADLTMNALTKNVSRLVTQYQYEVRNLTDQVEKQTVRLEQLDALIASYEKNEVIYLSTSEALTKIDGNSSETYNKLVDERKEVADNITDLNSQITDYQLKMADLLQESSQTPNVSAVSGEKTSDEAKTTEDTSAGEAGQTEETAAAGETEKTEDADAAGETAAAEETASDGTGTETADGTAPQTEGETAAAETIAALEENAAIGAEIAEMSEDEIAAAAEEAEQAAKRKINVLKGNIEALVNKKAAIVESLQELLQAYNEQEINDKTVTAFRFDYEKPELLSGSFIKFAIKVAGPVCALGFIFCMILNIMGAKKEEKKKAAA